ncbi:hypothetical protein F66182_896 [Fusarium sp. NRRL 66182]|nr:hypothetical protein F66182_896 [Fusarium sp. NRRL 66182]
MMATPSFETTPEKQAGFLNYFRQQLGYKPEAVTDVSLEGKTAIVTGSNCGVGLETSRQLLDLGLSRLILAVRNEDKGNAAAADLAKGRNPPLKEGTIEVWKLDLDFYDSVVAFSERAKSLTRLDIAVLNAGLCPAKREFNQQTKHDEIIQVNYLSTALLALLLLPIIKTTRPNQPGPTRLTFTSSEVAAWSKFKFNSDMPILQALDAPAKDYDTTSHMMTSKLLGQFLITELAKRVPSSLAIINGASPGAIHDSQFNREIDQTFSGAMFKKVMRHVAYTSAVGARMITDASVKHGEETHGQFLSFQKLVPMAPIIYTEDGKRCREQLWKETLEELAFVQPEDQLKAVSA